MPIAITAFSLLMSLGVNTHLDSCCGGPYQNTQAVAQSIAFLGVKNLRDSAYPGALPLWLRVAQAVPDVKFDDYMPEGSPSDMQNALAYMPTLAQAGLLNFVEGGNEEDDPYAVSHRNSLAWTAQFQRQVYQLGHAHNLPIINMSFGSGWTAENNWRGNYDKVGDLSAYADYANAHTYPNPGQTPESGIRQLNGNAKLAAASLPIVITEIGWDEKRGHSQNDIARWVLMAALDAIREGNVMTYYYALFDDNSGKFGLMNPANSDGTSNPKPAGTAIHNLVAIMQDAGEAHFTPGALSYSLGAGATASDRTLLFEKSDGSHWIAIWNEVHAPHQVTLKLGAAAKTIEVFDPLKGTNGLGGAHGVSAMTLTIPDHPVIVAVSSGRA